MPMKVKCAYVGCEKVFPCYAELESHMNVHMGSRPHVCDICDRGYPSRKGLNAHRSVHYPAAFQCAVCMKNFMHKAGLARHAATCQRTFVCGGCGKTYTREGNYRRHVLEKHPVKEGNRIGCDQCDLTFLSKFSLRTHKRIIHEGVRVSCRLCGRQYSYASSLYEHMQTCKPEDKKPAAA